MLNNRLFTLILALFTFTPIWAQTISNPVPDPIEFSGMVIDLETFATMPKGGPSNTNHPDNRPRINMMREVPGSDKIAVIDLNGYLWMMDTQGTMSLYLSFWDNFNNFKDASGKGTGSGAMAFHPEFATNGIFYTAHAEDITNDAEADFTPIAGGASCEWVITQWTASNPAAATFSGTKKEIVRNQYTTNIHGMQDITFNPFAAPADEDYGLLYVCNGEGGGSERGFHDNIGKKESYLGTIWRIDPAGSNSANGNYGIPATNPFVGTAGAVEENWAFGFRNPHRLSFEQRDEETILFVGDIGQHNIEEINLIEKGGNYGWDHREGTFDYNWGSRNVEALPSPDNGGYLYPVAQYDHDEGAAIALGYTWTNESIPALNGLMLFSDILYGDLFYVPMADLQQGSQQEIKEAKITVDGGEIGIFDDLFSTGRIDLRFFRDSDGKVWMFTKFNGAIYEVTGAGIKPTADFAVNVTSGNVPLAVSVDGSASTGNSALTYSWDFGDGTTKEGVTASHTYSENGSYSLTLTVNDGTEDSEVISETIDVNGIPTASFTVSEETASSPATILFDASGSSDPDGNSLRYTWDFGDGSTKGTFIPPTRTHIYEEAGTYTASLEINDLKGGTDIAEKTIIIIEGVVASSEKELSAVVIYPNPSNGILNIDVKKAYNFSLFDLQGKLMKEGDLVSGHQSIDLTGLNAGEYVLKLISGNSEVSSQVIIKK